MKKIALFLVSTVFIVSCMSKEEKMQKAEEEGNTTVSVKSRLLKGAGEALKTEGKDAVKTASEGVGEIIKGVDEGLDNSLAGAEVKIEPNATTYFELGRTQKEYMDSESNKKVSIYMIAKQDFKGKARLKAFDSSDTEIGRSTVDVEVKADDAEYVDFVFDERTPLLQAAHFSLDTK
ncbi:MAG: hypothetical protein ACK5IC_00310 [Moheibacter sp.]